MRNLHNFSFISPLICFDIGLFTLYLLLRKNNYNVEEKRNINKIINLDKMNKVFLFIFFKRMSRFFGGVGGRRGIGDVIGCFSEIFKNKNKFY